jgi:hypothetical protein
MKRIKGRQKGNKGLSGSMYNSMEAVHTRVELMRGINVKPLSGMLSR